MLRFKTTAEQTSHLNKFNFKPLVPGASRIAHTCISCNLKFMKIDEITTKNKETKKQKNSSVRTKKKFPWHVEPSPCEFLPLALFDCATDVVTFYGYVDIEQ